MSAHFDWYEASLDGLEMTARPGGQGDTYEAMCAWYLSRKLLEGCFDEKEFCDECDRRGWRLEDFYRRPERAFNHYKSALACYTPENVALFRLLWSPGSALHIIASGRRSPSVSAVLRRLCPVHYVTRADSALDFEGIDDFDRLTTIAEGLRRGIPGYKGRPLSSTTIEQDEDTGGRTFYLGSLKSETLMRIYDKAKEQRQKLPRHLWTDIPSIWTRAEVLARPTDKERRRYLSQCGPADVWRASAATTEFYNLLQQAELEKLERPKHVDDVNRAYWTMLQQYRRSFQWLLQRSNGNKEKAAARLWEDLETAHLL